MPIYSFKCIKCEHVEDMLRKVNESDRPITCPQCNGTMRKTFDQTNTGFTLKGPGWFKTDGKY